MGTTLVQNLFATNQIKDILQNFANSLGTWGNIIVLILGIAMVIVGVYQLAKALISHGKGQPPNWFVIIGLLLIGGLLIGTSLGDVSKLVQTGDADQILNENVDSGGQSQMGDGGWTRKSG